MASPNRSALIAKLYKVLKQHYKPAENKNDRQLLEHMLFACCLENAHYDKAEKTYQNLATSFFDWNEVRVSTVKELAEAMKDLPDPAAAASNLKRILQTVFESTYSFDLEAVKKQNIGAGIKRLGKLEGASNFVVAYTTQYALEGHFIPLDRGAVEVLYIVGIATDSERESGNVAGLERAIPKNKGIDFGSLLHQLAADFVSNPFSPNLKTLLLSINAEAKSRLPKRGQKKEEPKPMAVEEKAAGKAGGKGDGKAAAAKAAHHAKLEQNGSQKAGKADAKHAAGSESNAGGARKTAGGKAAADAEKKKLGKKEEPAKHKKLRRPVGAAMSHGGKMAEKRSASKQLTKRKPR